VDDPRRAGAFDDLPSVARVPQTPEDLAHSDGAERWESEGSAEH